MKRAHNFFPVSTLKPHRKPAVNTGPLSVVIDTDGNKEDTVLAILNKKREP